MSIKHICNRNVVKIDAEATVLDAARLMREHHVGDVVVVDQQAGVARPVGLLTDRDIVTLIVAQSVAPEAVKVSEVMARHPKVIGMREDAFDAAEIMREAGVRRLPVVDDHGAVVGILTADDLHQIYATAQERLAAVSQQQISREATGAWLTSRF